MLLPPTANVAKISSDDWTTACALTLDGVVKCFGSSYDAVFAKPNEGVEEVPSGMGKVRDLSVGRFGACALAEDGKIVCWVFSESPGGDALKNAPPVRAVAVATGAYNACAILENRKIKCWGLNKLYTGADK